jgi:hypothetical protein
MYRCGALEPPALARARADCAPRSPAFTVFYVHQFATLARASADRTRFTLRSRPIGSIRRYARMFEAESVLRPH